MAAQRYVMPKKPRRPPVPIVIQQPPIVVPVITVATSLSWHPLKLGAGGQVLGLDIAADGTKVCRTDVGGGYVWTGSVWTPLITQASMGAYFGFNDSAGSSYNDGGLYSIAIAPSVTSRFYMLYQGRMFRSDNSGVTWTFCSGWTPVAGGQANLIGGTDPLIAVDPQNADVVYVATTNNGLFVTTNGGTNWTSLSPATIATATADRRAYCICFDPTSAFSGGRTQGIYVSCDGTGVYHSSNAGSSWTLTTGTPTTHIQMAVSSTGVVWLTANDGGAQLLHKYASTTWSNPNLGSHGGEAFTIALNGLTIWIGIYDGHIITSTDGGTNWTVTTTESTRTATDIPWLGWTKEVYMTNGAMKWDATTSRLYFAEGIGVWYSTNPGPATDWTSQSNGIEELVGNMILAPPGGKPIACTWDRPLFRSADQDVYPSTHGPNRDNSIVIGFHCDYAPEDPTFLVALVNYFAVEESGTSSDGGITWTNFAGDPGLMAGGWIGGSIAAGSKTNYVWMPNNTTGPRPYYTIDSGATWNVISISGVPTTGETGWGSNWRNNRHILCADRVSANTFYAYNNGTANSDGAGTNADGAIAGVYRSTDGGVNWTQRRAGRFNGSNVGNSDNLGYGFDFYNAKLRAVPGNAGHLFYTAGQVGGSVIGVFTRSTDGGANWTSIPGVLMVYAFGFGKAQSGGYPAVYIAGWVGGVAAANWGIYRSDDGDQATPHWTLISDYPQSWRTTGGATTGNMDFIKWIEGDPDVFGRFYVAFEGTGCAYYG